MENEHINGNCGAKTCDWVVNGGGGQCVPGTTGMCFAGGLIEADESKLHDRKLIQATMNINDILNGLKDSSGNRRVSLLVTEAGIVLAWVTHEGSRSATPGDVTSDSDIGTVISALGLRVK